MFTVHIEFKNGNVIEGKVSKDVWFGIMLQQLLMDENVEHFVVD